MDILFLGHEHDISGIHVEFHLQFLWKLTHSFGLKDELISLDSHHKAFILVYLWN